MRKRGHESGSSHPGGCRANGDLAAWLLVASIGIAGATTAAEPTAGSPSSDESRLLAAILGPSPLGENLRQLTDEIGGRVSGSEANRRAVAWAVEAFRRAGVDSVGTESFTLPTSWMEGATRLEVISPWHERLDAVSIAWAPPTPPGGIEAPLVAIGHGTEADFARRSDHLAGALLLVDRDVLETWEDLFEEYATAKPVLQRAVAAGAAGVVWISTKTRGVLYRHMNTEGEIDVLPQVIVAREQGERLERALAAGQALTVSLDLPNEVGGPVEVDNVVAEIRGTDKADEIVAIGAHLDSWELGDGALDDGCNVALVIEIARALRAAGIRPRRTLRFLLWNGEEQGLWGSRSYVARHRDELDRYVAYLNIDGGVGRVVGFAVAGRPEVETALAQVLAPLAEWGVGDNLLDVYGGSDHVDFLLEGVPILDANQPVANYLPNYHASTDTMDKVPLLELRLNTAVMGTALLGIAQRDERIGERFDRAQVEELIERTGFEQYLRDSGKWEDFQAGRRGRALE